MSLSETAGLRAGSLGGAQKEAGGAWSRVATFYLLTTALALAAWLPYGAQLAGMLHTHIPAAVPIIGQYSPTIAALVMVAWYGGFAGVGGFLKRSLNPFVGLRWFAIAVSIPLLMALGLLTLHAIEGAYVPPLSALNDISAHIAQFLGNVHDTSGGAAARDGTIQSLAHWASHGVWQALLVLFGIAFANGGISEEAGWRGYALAELLKGRRAIVAALVVGLFWGLWHTGPGMWAGIFRSDWHGLSIPLNYTLGTIPLTVMMAWIFVNAKQNLLPTMFFHAFYNGTFFFMTQIWTPGTPAASIPEWLAATYVAGFAVMIAGRRTLFARSGEKAAQSAG